MKDNFIEKVLILKLKEGDKSAFSHIFSAYHKDLVLFVFNFSHNADTAEEIVQDMFVRIWDEHESLNINVSLRSFLLKSAKNKWIDWYRHQKVVQKYSSDFLENELKYNYDTDNYILKTEIEFYLDTALQKLPEELSYAFKMNRYEGLKYYEIAEKLNVSVRTVEVRISKVLKILHNELKDFLET